MEKKRALGSSQPVSLMAGWSFPRQPARVLVVEAVPPCWSPISRVLCEALENVLTLASSVDGPSRIPLLSVYAVGRQRECLLPFVPVRGNLLRLRSCVEELRSLPGEGCVRADAPRAEQLARGVLDSLQQFKQYLRHSSSATCQAKDNCSVEVGTQALTSEHSRPQIEWTYPGL
uniref:Meiosis 1 associated protein n=1 Tax=Neogobius melanostomus TaxID=47308 RepID=A0A8C6UB86_9GOBI